VAVGSRAAWRPNRDLRIKINPPMSTQKRFKYGGHLKYHQRFFASRRDASD
jgi:hypothetical protein